MGAITGNGSAISSNGKLRVWVLRPFLAAYRNFLPFFYRYNGQKSCYGKSRCLQPAEPNLNISYFIFYSY
jgi:hypothetical protein